MSTHVSIYFKYQGRMYSITVKAAVEEISLAMIEDRMYRKLSLYESKVKLELSYIPLVFGCEEQLTIYDDDDMLAYLTTLDKENRRSLLHVEAITRSDHIESGQMSRAGKSSVGMNYDELPPNDDETGRNVITPFVENEQGTEPNEVIEAGVDDETRRDDDEATRDHFGGTSMDILVRGDEYVEQPPYEESSQFIEAWEDGLGFSLRQEFPSRKAIAEVVDKAAFTHSYGYVIIKSDLTRWVVKCSQPNCKWGIRAARINGTDIFSIRRYRKMHSCSRASQSTSNDKRRGSSQLVASVLNAEFPGQMETPKPKAIMELVKRNFGLDISYSTALRGKNLAVSEMRGSPEESYEMLASYLYMVEQVNPGTITNVKVDDKGIFKYLFIALGASIEGFQCMRKVIIVDATFLKNGFGGVLVFANAQDPNRHHYPIAFGVLDGENNESWTWFFEMLKTVVPDTSELVFMSDRNVSLIGAIANVYPQAHHGHCVWHLAQNVKAHVSNVNKDECVKKFIELSRHYTVNDFNAAYETFKAVYPKAIVYVEKSTVKEKWARCCFEGDRYNLDTSNSVESLNSVFKDARKYSLIPMLDTIIRKFSDWFNDHRKDAVSGSVDNKLVPFVENSLHDLYVIAEKLIVRELSSYELEYEVTGKDGKSYLVSLVSKSCSCRVFDVEKYPCVHGLAAYIYFRRHCAANQGRGRDIQIELHELCSKYYWTEVWALAYYKTIYVVPAMSEWNVPDFVKNRQIKPPPRLENKGRFRVNRFPSTGERRRKKRTQNKRRQRQNYGIYWWLFGECSGQ